MQDTKPLLLRSDFPALTRDRFETLQVNLGYRCNQTCVHCHVNAGPHRTEEMDRGTIDLVLSVIDHYRLGTLDVTGGAPELNPHFRYLARAARERGVHVIDRCNLTILLEPGQEDLAEFLAGHRIAITASLPCYLEDNVDSQRGAGVFRDSIEALQRLNALGYGIEPDLPLDLVFNPQGPELPPPQQALEADYRRELMVRFGIRFNSLLTVTNMPISRFGATLLAKGHFEEYMALLRDSYSDHNLSGVMCRSLLSVDWRGYIYDCDFNQMLDMPLSAAPLVHQHLRHLLEESPVGAPIVTGAHCYGCTAGQGSSCSGALN